MSSKKLLLLLLVSVLVTVVSGDWTAEKRTPKNLSGGAKYFILFGNSPEIRDQCHRSMVRTVPLELVHTAFAEFLGPMRSQQNQGLGLSN